VHGVWGDNIAFTLLRQGVRFKVQDLKFNVETRKHRED